MSSKPPSKSLEAEGMKRCERSVRREAPSPKERGRVDGMGRVGIRRGDSSEGPRGLLLLEKRTSERHDFEAEEGEEERT